MYQRFWVVVRFSSVPSSWMPTRIVQSWVISHSSVSLRCTIRIDYTARRLWFRCFQLVRYDMPAHRAFSNPNSKATWHFDGIAASSHGDVTLLWDVHACQLSWASLRDIPARICRLLRRVACTASTCFLFSNKNQCGHCPLAFFWVFGFSFTRVWDLGS